ncbi:4Fe-4S ferredoxin iron-sulfur binding protein [Nocardioides sp. CF8]|uniref:FAD-dependent oxidoreductase n=1 Tax=Nocardioides sp. CF8 TaxID=110319 RepID=UPI00032DDBF3|nr:FAD-dependent oxidoreductase [Nocardioides sp. CF8]EON24239.1 4Fe-4S ferredoxin iron-sulfur binding protein [Nocardioides sp. CF8]
MPHVITQACCSDASCVFACPVNAIQPNPGDPDFGTAEMLYIDPKTCVDCGACIPACPVGAISRDTVLTDVERPFQGINAEYHATPRPRGVQARVPTLVQISQPARLRVAIVGAGPAGLYTADELLKQDGVEVTVYDRLPTPYGLVRAGVAPDHPETKTVTELFRHVEDLPGFHYALGVEVGVDVTHQDLLSVHSAVIYATGASQDRRLEIPGESLAHSATATKFVAWYNGHPDHAHHEFNLSTERVVIVGNGNVALDVARILATDPERLACTDIADPALEALRRSEVREVVLLGRRGPAQAAFTLPELTGLVNRADIDVVVEGEVPDTQPGDDVQQDLKLALLRGLPSSASPRDDRRRIVLRFLTSPVRVLGTERVTGLEVARNELALDGMSSAVASGDTETIETGLVLRSIGYQGVPVRDLPFDSARRIVPNSGGRVKDMPGTYVVGWIKRGPRGFIGTNRSCAHETVNHLLDDLNAGHLPEPANRTADLAPALRRLHPAGIGREGWRYLDDAERAVGAQAGRPRVKLTDPEAMRAVIASRDLPRSRSGVSARSAQRAEV